MKKILILFEVLFLCTFSYAQVVEGDANISMQDTISQEVAVQIAFEAAENAYERYFMQKIDPTTDKNDLYGVLLECFTEYIKSINVLNDTQLEDVKGRFRRLRPEFEEAGIYYSQKGNNTMAAKFLECYLNIPRLPFFEGEQFPKNSNYPAYVYNVAVGMFKANDMENAISYAQEYIDLGEKTNQRMCYRILAMGLDALKRFDEEANALEEGIMNYPDDIQLLLQGIELNSRLNRKDKAEDMLNKALVFAPSDPNLLFSKAGFDFDNGHYAEALPVYKSLHEQMPNELRVTKQLALCYYNLAGSIENEKKQAADAEEYKALQNKADENYKQAITFLEPLFQDADVEKNDPRIAIALVDALKKIGKSSEADQVQQLSRQNMNQQGKSASSIQISIPNFNDWYKPQLDKILKEWELRGEFEPTDEYVKRVNPDTRKALIAQTRSELEQKFINEYSADYNLSKKDMTLKIYDADHETYCIQTPKDNIIIRVPNADRIEAVKFKENWNSVKLEYPQFRVDKSGKLCLVSLRFTTSDGASYEYNANEPLEYMRIKVARPEWGDDDLLADAGNNNTLSGSNDTTKKNGYEEPVNVGASSVDVNIPRNKDKNENTFALIIANERYKNVEDVPFALNDGRSFKRYCEDVLGVPEGNIVHLENGTVGEMTYAIDRIKNYEIAYEGMKLLVYYSGHGVPDPRTNEAYLLPSDASPSNMSTGYKLSKFYSELTANNPKSVTVFLDACFSGAKKDGKVMDMAARGVIQEAREETPTTNMVVFSACTGSQTAYPYDNQKHGLFTYFLLKKLQEDKGKTTYKRLKDYIVTNVMQNSMRLYSKIQKPTTQSALPETEWGDWRLDK